LTKYLSLLTKKSCHLLLIFRMGLIKHDKYVHFRMTMSLRYLDTQLEQLEIYGFSRQNALESLELSESDFSDPNRRIDVARVERMYLVAAKALSEPRIGMLVGYKFRIHDYAQTGSIYGYCDNLIQVFEMINRYQRLAVDIAKSEYRIEDGRHYFIFLPYDEVKNMHHVMGMILGAYATSFRWLSWAAGHEIQEVALIPRAPDDTSLYEEAMQCPIIFGAPRNHAEFHPDSITTPLITRDPEKHAQAVAILDKLLQRGDESENFKTAVATSMRSAMNHGAVSLSIVAARMNVPERRLRQQLREQGLSFRDLLEDERKALFQDLYSRGESFAGISQALAYNDQPAFNRAFKRWYSMTPSQYKATKT